MQQQATQERTQYLVVSSNPAEMHSWVSQTLNSRASLLPEKCTRSSASDLPCDKAAFAMPCLVY